LARRKNTKQKEESAKQFEAENKTTFRNLKSTKTNPLHFSKTKNKKLSLCQLCRCMQNKPKKHGAQIVQTKNTKTKGETRNEKKNEAENKKRRGFAKNSRFRRCGVRSKKEKRKTNFSFFGRKSHTRRVFSLGRAGGMLSFFFLCFLLFDKNEKRKNEEKSTSRKQNKRPSPKSCPF
jgi:hypothetical protein